jgi:hypothetical protein
VARGSHVRLLRKVKKELDGFCYWVLQHVSPLPQAFGFLASSSDITIEVRDSENRTFPKSLPCSLIITTSTGWE